MAINQNRKENVDLNLINMGNNDELVFFRNRRKGVIHKYDFPCNDQTVCTGIKLELSKGTYFFELWGAQGGNSSDSENEKGKGGKGGYVNALIKLNKNIQFYLNIGAHGEKPDTSLANSFVSSTFNGGGSGVNYKPENLSNTHRFGCSGGGATDVRYESNDINNRILVASGGGGAGYTEPEYRNGGDGSGLNVICPESINQNICNEHNPLSQKFEGQSPTNGLINGGGGGGYYGGVVYTGVGSPGSGGTSYICNTSNCQEYIINGKIYETNEERPDYYNIMKMNKGHIGNGAIIITEFSFCTKSYNQLFISLSQSCLFVNIFLL